MKLSNTVSDTVIRKSFENQGFNKPQARELWLCVAHNIDIALIANIKYDPLLMRLMRRALQVNDDISSCYVGGELDVDALIELLQSYADQKLIGPLNYSHIRSVRTYPYRIERAL
jgi:hypothetical protein